MVAFNILIKHSILPVKNYFVAGAVLAGAVFILIRILFSTPSLVTYTILYAFTPSSFREREALLRVDSGYFLAMASLTD